MVLGSMRTPGNILLQTYEVVRGPCGPRISILGLTTVTGYVKEKKKEKETNSVKLFKVVLKHLPNK